MCTIGWASDYHNMPRWVVVLCMYRRCENMRLATTRKASHNQQEKQALHERFAEIEALKEWARLHEQEWSMLPRRCESEWRERMKAHGELNFGAETLVHVCIEDYNENQASWDKVNERSVVKAIQQAFPGDDHSHYIRPETPSGVPHRIRIFVDPKQGALKHWRYTLW